jgi:hypothetical protein
MKRNTEFARVAMVVVAQFPAVAETNEAEILAAFCDEEDMLPIIFIREETSSGLLDARGYQTIMDMLDKDMIDGVLVISGEILDGEFGNKLVADSEEKDFFIMSYEQEMAIRAAEAQKQNEALFFAKAFGQGVDILSVLVM